MMMDDSIIYQEVECLNMEHLENELNLTYLPHGQSTFMMKCVTQQTLAKWLKTFLIYMEIYSLDVEDIMEVELNEVKNFGIIPFKGSKETQSIELQECRTLMMNFVIIGKTMTSNEKVVSGKLWVFYRHVEKHLMVNDLDYGLENH